MTGIAQAASPRLAMPLREAVSRAVARITWQVVVVTFVIALALQVWSVYEAAVADESLVPVFLSSLIANVLIAFSIMFTTFVADEFVGTGRPPLPVYASGIVVGSALGSAGQWLVHEALYRSAGAIHGLGAGPAGTRALFVFFEYLIWGSIGVWIHVNRRGEMRAKARMDAARLQRSEIQRRSLEAQLAALQAQVEPRFLLDVLARARDRYDVDPAAGSAMLGALITYLRTALPRLREHSSDLGRELELARAYVDVMRAHQGDAFSFECHVPDALRQARMAPMLLLPLIHHVVVRRAPALRAPRRVIGWASVAGGLLRVRIVHDGQPFMTTDDDVAGVRQRLRALYREKATLTFDEGNAAILEIPHEPSDSHHR